jgi:hypothetical protein
VLGHVPKAERCQCRERSADGGGVLGKALRALIGR